MKWPLRIPVVVILLGPIVAWAQATRPKATTERLQRWVIELADVDPAVRATARESLFGLNRADLASLRDSVARLSGVDRVSAETLREIVVHVYLAEAPYEREEAGFLGIRMVLWDDGREEGPVVVEQRMPGFCAYPVLEDGDLIVQIEEAPAPEQLTQSQLIRAIKAFKPGQRIHLKVLRKGKELRVPLVLDARPAPKLDARQFIDAAAIVDDMTSQRQKDAGDYWDKTFRPILDRSGEHAAP